jgi:hypothetical protein
MKGRMTQADIGKLFGIGQTHVGRIHRGEAWVGWAGRTVP